MIMRRIINIFAVFAVIFCVAASCEKATEPNDYIDAKFVGEWHLVDAKAEGVTISSDVDVYLSICSDCTFELYQKSGTQSVRYDKFTGICSCDGKTISGTYSTGEPWASKYTYSFTSDEMILKSFNLLEEQRYIKADIPAKVKEDSNVITKSTAASSTAPIL